MTTKKTPAAKKRPTGRPPNRRISGPPPGKPYATPLEFLLATMRDEGATDRVRTDAAIAAARYVHSKPSTGARAQAQEAAQEVVKTSALYRPRPAPTSAVFQLRPKPATPKKD